MSEKSPEHFISTHCRTLWIYESLFKNQFWQFSVSNCTGLDLQTPTCRLYRCPGCSGPFLCPPNCLQVWANTGQISCRWSHMNQESQLQNSPGTNLEKRKEKQAQIPLMPFDPQLHNWIYIWRLERNKVALLLEDFIWRSETRCWHGDVIHLMLRWMKYRNMLFWIYLEGLKGSSKPNSLQDHKTTYELFENVDQLICDTQTLRRCVCIHTHECKSI